MKYWKSSTQEPLEILNSDITMIGVGVLSGDPFNHELSYNEDTGVYDVIGKSENGKSGNSKTSSYSQVIEKDGFYYLKHIDTMRRSVRKAGGYEDQYCDYVLDNTNQDTFEVEELEL